MTKNLQESIFSLTFAPLKLNVSNGALAQLVEHRTENPCVPGSIPGGTTPPFISPVMDFRQSGVFFCLIIKQLQYKIGLNYGLS